MPVLAGPFGLGPLELGLIVIVLLLLFGATRLADVGGSLGKGIKEFRKNIKDDEEDAPADPVSAAPVAPVASAPAAPVASSQNGEGVVSAVKCPNCGNLNPMGARHCNQCGTALGATVS